VSAFLYEHGCKRLKLTRLLTTLLLMAGLSADLLGQELQPRRWAALPSGINFVGAGAGWTFGDINFDPALLIEDAEVELAGMAGSYLRTFGLLGKQARVDIVVPYGNGHWEGLLDGEPASVRRSGFGDAQLRFAYNFIGPPAQSPGEFRQYLGENPVDTTAGIGVTVIAPTGEYRSDRLINLGNNRWVVRPEIGVLHQRNNWQFEATGSVFIFGDNDEFWMGTVREQEPLWFAQGHAIYTFRPGLWAGLSGGYAWGGRSEISGVRKGDDSRLRYLKLTLGIPINARQGLSIAFASGRTNTLFDSDLDNFAVGWSLMF
jgi:hypothetical protein